MKATRRKSILEKFARKNMAEAAKITSALFEQNNQLKEIQELMERVRELQENSNEKTFASSRDLRASRWYSLKLAEQTEILANRIEFFEREIAELRKVSRDKSLKNVKLDELIKNAKQMVQLEKDRELDKK